jgi:hypothetical protein
MKRMEKMNLSALEREQLRSAARSQTVRSGRAACPADLDA